MKRTVLRPSQERPPAIDPQDMTVFAALARAGGVRRAATLLGVPRSTISRRLARLEAAVGAALVVRTARRFALTDMGAAMVERCERLEQLVRESAELAQQSSSEPSGTLRVAVAPVLGEEILPGILGELTSRYPLLAVEARVSVDYANLRSGDVDVALRARALQDATDLFAVRLGTSVTGCYVSPRYAEAHGVPKKPADLEQHECILVGSAQPPTWRFRFGARDQAVPVRGRVRVDSFRVARDLAACGAGIVQVASVFAEPLVARSVLVPILVKYWPSTPLYAAHAGPNPPPPKVRAFIDLARDAVARAFQSGGRDGKGPSRWRSA